MAEFSKQYCALHDMGFEGDFDIEQVAESLEPGYARYYICEGFGFTMIGKNGSGVIELGFSNTENSDITHWIPYLHFMQKQNSSL